MTNAALSSASASSVAIEEKQALSALTAMVVDDHATMRRILRGLLKELGISNIIEAADGQEALDYLEANDDNRPDFILSDLNMDGMDGLEFCNRLRRSEAAGSTPMPVLVLTGEQNDLVLDVVRQVGACEVLAKPISLEELGNHIAAVVGFSPA